MPGIRRIAEHHHHRRFILHLVGAAGFFCQPLSKERQVGHFVCFFQRVGEENAQAFVAGKIIAGFAQQQAELHVRHGIRRHQQLKTIHTRQQIFLHVTRPHSFIARKGLVDLPDDAIQKSAGSGGRRSEEHTSELQSQFHLVCRLLLEKKKKNKIIPKQKKIKRKKNKKI